MVGSSYEMNFSNIKTYSSEDAEHCMMKSPVCKKCGSERTTRKERKGFFQEVLMFKLGRYPWECNACWKTFLSPERGKRTRRSRVPENSAPLDASHV